MFVFVLIFAYFQIPAEFRHLVLFYRILGSLLFRGIFIALGSTLLQFSWVVILFGIFLVFTGLKMMVGREHQVDPEKSWVMRLVRKIVPVTPKLAEQQLLTRIDSKLHATTLLLTLAAVETADIICAVDSVRAIFVTHEFIVYSSNVFAILGLPSMDFLLAGAIGRFHLLGYGASGGLDLLGTKDVVAECAVGRSFSDYGFSRCVIGLLLTLSIGLSLPFPKRTTANLY